MRPITTTLISALGLALVLSNPADAAPRWWWWRTPEPVSTPLTAQTQSQASPTWREASPLTAQVQWPSTPVEFQQAFPQGDWWRSWGDTTLDTLITEALTHNPNLAVAEASIKQAQALADVARASRFPTAQVGFNYNLQRFSANQFGGLAGNVAGGGGGLGAPGRTFQFYSTPLSARYEVDLWAQNRDRALSAKQTVALATHDYRNLMIQLSSLVATAYVNLLATDEQLRIQQEIEQVLTKQVEQYQKRLDVGLGTRDEVALRQQNLASARQQTASLQTTRAVALDQLAVLLGRTPAQVTDIVPGRLEQLALPTRLAVGVPSEMLVHRPDILAQEAVLERSAINVRVARKEFLPKVVLTGQTGFSSVGAAKLFRWDSLASSAIAGLTQPLFTGGVLKGNLAAQKAVQEQATQQYLATLQAAFQEVEDSLARYKGDLARYQEGQTLLEAVASQSSSESLRLQAGLGSELTYLPTQVVQLQAQQALASQKAALLVDAISVNKAVGGGF